MIPVRDDLRALEGYHSAQVDVRVRLNTNESPEPPPAAFRDAVAAEVSRVDWHRYPDRAATELREAIAATHGVDASQVFAANGSNEVLQTVLLAYAGPGRTVATFEPTYQMHAQIARVTGATVVEGERAADFSLDPAEVERVLTEHRPHVVFLTSPNNPTGLVEPVERVRQLLELAPGLVVVDEAYAQFADWTALDLVGEDVPLVVTRTFSKTWSMAGARLGYLIGPSWLVAELDKVVLPYHLDAVKQIAGRLALRYSDDMNDRVEHIVAERSRIVDAMSELPLDVFPSGANFVLFRVRPGALSGRDVWQGLVDRSVLIRDCSSWPRLDDCLRVTIGTPDENTEFLTALADVLAAASTSPVHRIDRSDVMTRTAQRRRATKETSIEIDLDLDGTGATDISTGIPFYDHMLDQIGRHGGFDLRVQAVGDLHIDTHHTVEDVAIALGEAFAEALGDKAGVRRFASGRYPLDEALIDVALDLSGRPWVEWHVPMPESLPLGDPAFDPQLAEHAIASFATAANITLHVELVRGRNVHHIIEATFKGLARTLRDAVRVDDAGGVPSTKGVL